MVNHDILLKKLEHYGVRGTAFDWFSSYLSNREQFVSVNGQVSEKLAMNSGVPQGSVLGPLLFLLYINNLPNASKILSLYLFSDDTNIYFESSNLLHFQKTMNKHLRYVIKWLDVNKLASNLDKTNFVLFHSTQVSTTELIRLKFGKKQTHQEMYVNFLGVLLDEHFTWKYHITEVSRKLARVSGVFFKIRYFLPIGVLKSFYYAMFFAFLQYGIAVWGLTYLTYLQPFFILQ